MLPEPILTELPASGPLVDRFARRHTYLRVSVTDRCNYRCVYCLPAHKIDWLPRADVLSIEEIARLVSVFASLGVKGVRLTGGEPLVRRGIVDLVRRIAATPGVDDVAMTTNGHGLAELASELRTEGLRRVNVSLDTLDPERFRSMTRGGDVTAVLAGIDAAIRAGLTPLKLNVVVLAGENESDVPALVDAFAHLADRVVVRFIEKMPFRDEPYQAVPSRVLRERLAERYTLDPIDTALGRGPSAYWRIRETGQTIGFISPMTEHFCEACNRLRLQADGSIRTCLSRENAPNLRDVLRAGATDDEVRDLVRRVVWGKVAGHEAHVGARTFEGVMTRIGG